MERDILALINKENHKFSKGQRMICRNPLRSGSQFQATIQILDSPTNHAPNLALGLRVHHICLCQAADALDLHIRKRICLVPIGIGLDNSFHSCIPPIEIHRGVRFQKSACLRTLYSRIKGPPIPHRIKNVHTGRIENPAELQQLPTAAQQFAHL